MSVKKNTERIIWISITCALILLLVLLSYSPVVLAQSRDPRSQEMLELFYDVFTYVQNYYADEDKIDPENLIQGAIDGMMKSLDDPHSVFLDSDRLRELTDTTKGEFYGIGIYIGKTERGFEVARPISGTPADKEGLSAGDLIIAIEDEPTEGLSLDDVINKIRGESMTDITLTILRGRSEEFDVTITRGLIEIPTVIRTMISDDTGYMIITEFTPMTLESVIEAILYFNNNNYKNLIIDLRSNPGGLLTSVVNVADLFFEENQLIVSTKSRITAENRTYFSKSESIVPGSINIVVLIDKFSASAAEILTGVLKDTGRATILGETSYGKGSVQQIIPIALGGIKLTISKYFTPSDISIDKIGIKPDIEVKREPYSDGEIESLTRLFDENLIPKFVEENPAPDNEKIKEFISSLETRGINIREERIRKEIRNELNRYNNTPPIYDLDYDIVLKKALNFFKGEGAE